MFSKTDFEQEKLNQRLQLDHRALEIELETEIDQTLSSEAKAGRTGAIYICPPRLRSALVSVITKYKLAGWEVSVSVERTPNGKATLHFS